VEHWDGASWAIAPSANQADASHSILSGVSCPTWTMCMRVGSYAARAGVFTLTEYGG